MFSNSRRSASSCVALSLGIFLAADVSAATLLTTSLTIQAQSAVWDPTSGRFFVSVGSGDPKWPSSIAIVNPNTGQVVDSIPAGDNPGSLAISNDGQYLYVALNAKGTVRRFHLPSHTPDFDISVGPPLQYGFLFAMAVLPQQPRSVLVANGTNVAVYDGNVSRGQTAPFPSSAPSLYARQDNGLMYGYSGGVISVLTVNSSGVSLTSSQPAFLSYGARANFSGSLVTDDYGDVFDLDALAVRGHLALPSGVGRCISVADPSGTSVLALPTSATNTPSLERFSLSNFLPVQEVPLDPGFANFLTNLTNSASLYLWGADGIAIFYGTEISVFEGISFATTSTLTNVSNGPPPAPSVDSSGVIHLGVPVSGIVYDSQRNLLWASVKGFGGSLGNHLIAVDPSTGNIGTQIYAGSDPGTLAISDDQQRVFAALAGIPAIASINLTSQTSETPYPVNAPGTQGGGFLVPESIAAIPGEPQSVVAISEPPGTPGNTRLVAVYDRTGPRPQTFTKTVDVIINGDSANAFFAQNDSTSDFGLYRLVVNANGIALDKQLDSIATGFGDPVAYANGYLFEGGGSMWAPDTSQLVGVFAAGGVPLPLPDQNEVVYVGIESSTSIGLASFDLNTFRPIATLSVPTLAGDSAVSISTAIRAGTDRLALIFGSEIMVVPLAALQPVPALVPSLTTVASGVLKSTVPANAIAVPPGTSKLVITTPSTALNLGNSVLIMDPGTGNVGASTFAGSEPSNLALSSDGTYAYTYLSGTGMLSRINLVTSTRDLIFSADPAGQGQQVAVNDLCVGPDGGLAVSYAGGTIAIFDQTVPRPQIDYNGDNFAEFDAAYQLAFDASGTRLYGYDQVASTFDLKRWSVQKTGVTPLSLSPGLTTSFTTQIRFANGLLYSSNGDVIDPERSRDIGQFQYPNFNQPPGGDSYSHAAVYPDVDTGRVYFLFNDGVNNHILVFDMYSYALLGAINLPSVNGNFLYLVKPSSNVLAFNTTSAELYFINISAIPLNSSATPPPPVDTLPQTPGVAVLDLAVNDLVYDSSRDRIYASVPDSEGELANSIVAIDPGQAAVTTSYAAGPNPMRVAISDDDSELYFAMGLIDNTAEYIGGGLRRIDLASGTITAEYATSPPPASNIILSIPDLVVLPGEPHSVAVIENFQVQGTVSIFDDTTPRPVSADNPYLCASIQPSATASRLYCYDGDVSSFAFSRLAVDSSGVTLVDSSGPGLVGGNAQILFNNGRVYSTNGKIIDPEKYQLLGSVPANGPVAVDGNTAYWLETGTSSTPSMILQAFDATTFAPISSRTINVGTIIPNSTNITRLIPCGQGRLAFGVGNQVFIVYPAGAAPPTPSPSANSLTNAASGAPGAADGSLVSLYGSNLVSGGTSAVAATLPLPTELDGVSVTIGGRMVPLLAAVNTSGAGQINFQMPYGLAGHGSLPLVVNNGGILSNPVEIQPLPAQPGVFLVNGQGAILHQDFSFVTSSSPASAGETIIIYCTGLGAVNPQIEAGFPAPTSPLAASATPAVTIGGVSAQVSFSGLAPGFVGLYQVNVMVPQSVSGTAQLVIAVGAVSSAPVSLVVE